MVFRKESRADSFQRQISTLRQQLGSDQDDFDEGETEFMYQQRKVTPKVGSLLIAPAGFTHTHRGNQPKRGNKYIATSWILFQPAEQLYAAPGAPS